MAFITVICPLCGGQTQIEAMKGAMCPYCGSELNTAQGNQGFAFAPQPAAADQFSAAGPQYAGQPEMMQQNVQFAPPPMPVQAQPNAMPMQYGAPAQFRQYSPQEIAAAGKRRGQWRFLNIAMIAVQALIMTFSIALADYFFEDWLAGLMILAWLFSQPVCAILSGVLRPDDAYIAEKPLFKKKWVQSLIHFLISLPASAAAGGILYAILRFIADAF
jgi:hypothetical protein